MRKHGRRELLVVAVGSIYQLPALAQPQRPPDELIPALRRLRAECEDAASAVKSRFASSHTGYIVSRRKYGAARAAIEEVAGFLKQAILSGNEESIRKSDSLARAANDAKLAASDFLESADKALGISEKRSLAVAVGVLASIVAIAIDLLKGAESATDLGAKVEERRAKRAAQIEQEIVWSGWDNLTDKK